MSASFDVYSFEFSEAASVGGKFGLVLVQTNRTGICVKQWERSFFNVSLLYREGNMVSVKSRALFQPLKLPEKHGMAVYKAQGCCATTGLPVFYVLQGVSLSGVCYDRMWCRYYRKGRENVGLSSVERYLESWIILFFRNPACRNNLTTGQVALTRVLYANM